MDQAESSSPQHPPDKDRPEQRGHPSPAPPTENAAASGGHSAGGGTDAVARDQPLAPALAFAHPVIAGYDGSASSRNALAYAVGVSVRLGRPLLVVYVCSSGAYCEPLTGQVVGLPRDTEALERWLLTEFDRVTGPAGVEVHVRTRRGSAARELAAAAEEFSADALVIGAPTHFWHRVAGSVPGWLARHARCPVIVVP
jgi:nucleotide-binding universal stress UspA family protein